MGILKAFFNNTRKPKGLLGRCMVGSMNRAHAALAQKEKRHSDQYRRPKTDELPFRQPKHDFGFYFCQVLRDRYIRQSIIPP